ncbi:hypothetical protein MSIMFI_02253 [Mycobacterium simulans]|nr:hypothetical protein [Mycobacterium simulans]SON60752.1 hypothetical protein MSIMFI_02253 [Mycobacterium simulans]
MTAKSEISGPAHGLGDVVKDNDSKFPPEWRLSKKDRKKKRQG